MAWITEVPSEGAVTFAVVVLSVLAGIEDTVARFDEAQVEVEGGEVVCPTT